MRNLVILAALWLTASQTVSFSNCCRGALCSQKEDCPPCGSVSDDGRTCCEDEGSGGGASESREPKEKRGDGTPCIHVEPSMDVVDEVVSPSAEAPAPSGFLRPDPLGLAWDEVRSHRASQGVDPPLRPGSSPPLYLLDRALRI